jgi:hypothetical protein
VTGVHAELADETRLVIAVGHVGGATATWRMTGGSVGRLPEAWVAPPAVRELREEVRYRAKSSRLQTGLKCQVHQVLGKEG